MLGSEPRASHKLSTHTMLSYSLSSQVSTLLVWEMPGCVCGSVNAEYWCVGQWVVINGKGLPRIPSNRLGNQMQWNSRRWGILIHSGALTLPALADVFSAAIMVGYQAPCSLAFGLWLDQQPSGGALKFWLGLGTAPLVSSPEPFSFLDWATLDFSGSPICCRWPLWNLPGSVILWDNLINPFLVNIYSIGSVSLENHDWHKVHGSFWG